MLTFLRLSTIHLNLSSELQMGTSNCLLNIFTWIPNRYLKFNKYKTEFLIFPAKDPAPSSGISNLLLLRAQSSVFLLLHQSMCQWSLWKMSRIRSPPTTPATYSWAGPSFSHAWITFVSSQWGLLMPYLPSDSSSHHSNQSDLSLKIIRLCHNFFMILQWCPIPLRVKAKSLQWPMRPCVMYLSSSHFFLTSALLSSSLSLPLLQSFYCSANTPKCCFIKAFALVIPSAWTAKHKHINITCFSPSGLCSNVNFSLMLSSIVLF